MTDDEIDQVVEATSPPVRGWTKPFRRFGRWFRSTRAGTILARKTTVANLIAAVLVMASGYPLVIASIGATDRRVTNNAIYTTQQLTWKSTADQYSFCLDVVNSQIAGRERWVKLVDFIAALGPDARTFADNLRTTLLSDDPPTTDTCKSPGPAPEPPAN